MTWQDHAIRAAVALEQIGRAREASLLRTRSLPLLAHYARTVLMGLESEEATPSIDGALRVLRVAASVIDRANAERPLAEDELAAFDGDG